MEDEIDNMVASDIQPAQGIVEGEGECHDRTGCQRAAQRSFDGICQRPQGPQVGILKDGVHVIEDERAPQTIVVRPESCGNEGDDRGQKL